MRKQTPYITNSVLPFLIVFNVYSQDHKPDVNVIYGDHHIYTVETPLGWINDKAAAQSIGLTNFFYNEKDQDKKYRSYIYTNGIDKSSSLESIIAFTKADIEVFLKKYPDAKMNTVELDHTPPILDGMMISFSNLSDRYKEEVIYLETKETIIIISFAAFTEEDYDNYKEILDNEFIPSFKYRGNNPKPFLEWMEINH